MDEQREPNVRYVLRVPAQGIDVPVHEGETDGQALTRAAQEMPELAARALRAEQARASGRGIPAAEVYAELGYAPPAQTGRKSTGRRPTAGSGKLSLRLPIKLHKELIAQAEREGVSLNTLLVSYLAREAGVQASERADG